ncbi:TonB-dependent receptor [Undibacterium sp. KW1]|uniref:TonB-dependent receptor n=1 Tax=Undibacterium sp. KW1 TaxID=2058624 RepID=UPI001331C83C|nr:TonB-dependent receptor [Undibacterium sp. KW1]BBB60811.1 TonB-dependent receptor [Undibacterium sp. KW1]
MFFSSFLLISGSDFRDVTSGRHFTRTTIAMLIASAFTAVNPIPVLAQTMTDSDNSALELGRVEITGKRVGPVASKNVLSSVDILGSDLIQTQQVINTWELFAKAPGVMLTQFRQGSESGKLSFRGFNGEGEVNAVKLLIDGIPSNDNAGGMPFLDMIFPLEIKSIEVVRGTNDPRYGLHNIAGNANVVTRTGGNYSDARITYGSFDTKEIQAAKGFENDNWSQNYFIGYLKSGGYRDNATFDKYTVGGKWFYTTNDAKLRLGVIARHTVSNGDEPGYLTASDAYSNPTLSYPYAQAQGANRQMNQLSFHIDGDMTENLSASTKFYLNQVSDQRWLRYSSTTSQQERIIDETHFGGLSSVTYRPNLTGISWIKDFVIEGGVNVEHQDDKSPRYNTVNKVRVTTTRDQSFKLDNYGAYLQAIVKPVDTLKIIPAYRIDKFDGSFNDLSKNLHYEIQDYGVIGQPKLSVVYSPLKTASVYGNWGRTFQIGAGAASYKSNRNDLRPSINDGWEAGLKFSPAGWVDGRIAAWEQSASDEVKRRLNDPTGDSENVGRTRRSGFDIQVNVRPDQRSNAWFSYSRQRSKILVPDPTAPATAGKEIDHVPGYVFSAGYDLQITPALQLSVSSNGQGDYYLTTTNTGSKFGAYALFNMSAKYKVSPALELEFQTKNITNRYYEYVWINDQSRHSPGDGRAFYMSANMKF